MICVRSGVATKSFGCFGRNWGGRHDVRSLFLFVEGNLSVQAITWVLDHSQSRGFSRLVLISIANHADKFGREAFPANKTIAEEAGVSEREVRYCIADLVKLGEVTVDYKASKYGTNIYAFAKMHPAQYAGSPGTACQETRQAPGTESPPTRQACAPEPSLTVKRDDAPSAPISPSPPEEKLQNLKQLLDDYYGRRWLTDETGKRYLIAPASPHRRVYESELL